MVKEKRKVTVDNNGDIIKLKKGKEKKDLVCFYDQIMISVPLICLNLKFNFYIVI